MDKDISLLKGIGQKNSSLFRKLNINTVRDLMFYFPRDYQDLSRVTKINQTPPGQINIKATISNVKGRYVKRGMHITEAVASDDTGSIKLVWFNQTYRESSIKPDKEYYISGKLEFRYRSYSVISPTIELVGNVNLQTARIVPIYRETKGLKSTLIRKATYQALTYVNQLSNVLPDSINKAYDLMSYHTAVANIHFPENSETLERAQRTMSFIELFELMLASKLLKSINEQTSAPEVVFDERLARDFVAKLPFKLTDAQRKVMWTILKDIYSDRPMNRLIEGDVGSGKTVVASMAMNMTLNSGLKVVYLAPTEVLARQQYGSLKSYLKSIGLDDKIHLLIGATTKSKKSDIYDIAKRDEPVVLVGTHALITGFDIKDLGLVIVDEQHRFGVDQRNILLKQNKLMPHILSMTATPIPRSLALTLYGELDISLLDSMPPGRKPIETELVLPSSRTAMSQQIREQLSLGHQVYVVCPLIEESSVISSANVQNVFKRLKSTEFKDKNIELLHGKMKSKEKERIMGDFVSGKIDILVSTTVIEVGVNVPNATVMVIEGAERFGLAQMHQLRGRVGRSDSKSYCFVVPSDDQSRNNRLSAFCRVLDGFKLAELDLKLRGPGAIYGRLQHGALDFRFADLTDSKLIASVREAVDVFMKSYDLADYDSLAKRVRLAQAVVTLN